MGEVYDIGYEDIIKEWNDLFDEVRAYQTKKESASAKTASEQQALLDYGLKPKSKLLNFLLDAVSLKLAESERKAETGNDNVRVGTASINMDSVLPLTSTDKEVAHSGSADLKIPDVQIVHQLAPTATNCEEDFQSTYDLIKDFDKIPERPTYITPFKYKEPKVRKKSDLAALPGWVCERCKEYYDNLDSQMDEIQIAALINKCSKHRSKLPPPESNTPEGFWCTEIPSTQDLYDKGYIRVAEEPFTPIARPSKAGDESADSYLEDDAP